MTELAERILRRDPRAIARAATAIENRAPGAELLLRTLFPHTGRAIVYGVTGPPGAGKSTFVDQLAALLRTQQRTVGIIAVDPTSPFSGGAILGDRIRMQRHHADPGVFIRSMATRGALGGLARATSDLALLLDAAGFDDLLIETIGAGQDEVDVARMAAVTAVILTPGAGDDVQAIKAGMMEIADIIVINKADLAGADKLERELKAGVSLARGPTPAIVRTVASEGTGIPEALAAMRAITPRKARSVESWTLRLGEMLRERLAGLVDTQELDRAAAEVAERRTDPYTIVGQWFQRITNIRE